MVNPGAHYRCPEACGGLFAVWESNGAYNTVYVRAVVEHCSRRRTGYGPWYRGLTCALPFLFAHGPFRVGVPGRMALVGQQAGFLRVPGRRRRVGVGSSILSQAF